MKSHEQVLEIYWASYKTVPKHLSSIKQWNDPKALSLTNEKIPTFIRPCKLVVRNAILQEHWHVFKLLASKNLAWLDFECLTFTAARNIQIAVGDWSKSDLCENSMSWRCAAVANGWGFLLKLKKKYKDRRPENRSGGRAKCDFVNRLFGMRQPGGRGCGGDKNI